MTVHGDVDVGIIDFVEIGADSDGSVGANLEFGSAPLVDWSDRAVGPPGREDVGDYDLFDQVGEIGGELHGQELDNLHGHVVDITTGLSTTPTSK